MNIATIKKWAFISGIIILVINVLGICTISYNDVGFDFGNLFYTLKFSEVTTFAILSILSSTLLIYGITPINSIVYIKRAKAVFIIGIVVLVYLIITLLIMDYYNSYWINVLLLFISSAAMIISGVKYSIKKEADTFMENEKSNDNINQI